MIGLGINTKSRKSTFGLRVSFASRVESKSKNWNSHSFPIKWMWLSKASDSISRSIGKGIDVGSGNWFKLGNKIEST